MNQNEKVVFNILSVNHPLSYNCDNNYAFSQTLQLLLRCIYLLRCIFLDKSTRQSLRKMYYPCLIGKRRASGTNDITKTVTHLLMLTSSISSTFSSFPLCRSFLSNSSLCSSSLPSTFLMSSTSLLTSCSDLTGEQPWNDKHVDGHLRSWLRSKVSMRKGERSIRGYGTWNDVHF